MNGLAHFANRLAHGSLSARGRLQYALNNRLCLAGPTFDASLALEFMGFDGPDLRAGLQSLRERREPDFSGDALL